jgi:hypothetical protein
VSTWDPEDHAPWTPIEPSVWWDDGPDPIGVIYGPTGDIAAVIYPPRQPFGFQPRQETPPT